MAGWKEGGYGWSRARRRSADLPDAGGWTLADTATIIVAVMIRWEVAAAFVALKLWHQASGYRGTTFAFAREKWEALVAMTRSLLAGGAVASFHVGPRSSGNHAFDRWRVAELDRIKSERERLQKAEREFAAYRDELLHAKDREDFERFMQAREGRAELRREDRV